MSDPIAPIELVNICAPADAPKGAPLLFDPDAPGHCRWGVTPLAVAAMPEEAQQLILDMAEQVRSLNVRMIDHARRLDDVERLLSGIGAVTLDDLIKRSAA